MRGWSSTPRSSSTPVRGGEARQVVVAPIDDRLYLAVVTRRGDAVRVISVRKANAREVKAYGKATQRR
jgi:uncharacterized DUF497 family protein